MFLIYVDLKKMDLNYFGGTGNHIYSHLAGQFQRPGKTGPPSLLGLVWSPPSRNPPVSCWATHNFAALPIRGWGSASFILEDEVFQCSFSLNGEQSGSLVVETEGNRTS